MNKDERSTLAHWAVNKATKTGADQAAVTISKQRNIQIQYRDKKLEKLQESTKNTLSLRIYAQNRYSLHTTCDMKKESVATLISDAIAATKYLAEDKYRSLPDPKYYPEDLDLDLQLCDQSYDGVKTSQRIKIAQQMEDAARSQGDKIVSATAHYSDTYSQGTRVHSNGLSTQTKGTRFSVWVSATAQDADGAKPAAWDWAGVRFASDLPSPQSIGKGAATRAMNKIGQKKIASGKYDMIVENRVLGQLITMLQEPMQGRQLQQKNSFLDKMLNKKVASEKLTMIDDPLIMKGSGSRLFDSQGLAAKKRIMIDKGILRHYYADDYYSRKLGIEPTSGSVSNLVFEHGPRSVDRIIADTKKAILVAGFIGGNFNSTTGDFSFGIFGQLIENGVLTQPISQMNISGNAKDFWNRILEIANDPDPYSSWRTPTMLFEAVSFSGL